VLRALPVIAVLLSVLPMQGRGADVIEVAVDGVVSPATRDIVTSAIAQASRDHADAVLVRLSTPGGLMDSTREIVEQVFHSPLPVIMWTGPSGARAASAGFFLLEAGDIAAMAPGTNTGASHPVIEGAQMDPVMKQKLENDAAALMRTIVMHRGRNEAAAEKTVRESASYTDREALNQHLIDLIAPDEASLLKALDGREITRFDGSRATLHLAGRSIAVFQPSLRLRVLAAIADPNIALLLLVLGAMGIYAEFSMPGMVAPGVIGAMLILLGLTALSVFPIDWLGAGLMVLALIFFVLEAKFTTHGILTAGGAVAMLVGALMLIDTGSTGVPDTLRIRLSTALALTIPFALITSFLLSIAMRARRNKVTTGAEGMMGASAVALGDLNPEGMVQIHGEYWKAQASKPVAASEPVRITGIDGLTLQVEPIPASAADSTLSKLSNLSKET
jgi:membrane-bound serine protease (ClpP class)